MMRAIAWFVRIVVFLLLLGFALQNTEPVIINFYLGYFLEAPLVAILLGVLLIGCLIGALLVLPSLLRVRREVSRLRREVASKQALNSVPTESEASAIPKL
jgi:lipopolysaccharide assembly protein A